MAELIAFASDSIVVGTVEMVEFSEVFADKWIRELVIVKAGFRSTAAVASLDTKTQQSNVQPSTKEGVLVTRFS